MIWPHKLSKLLVLALLYSVLILNRKVFSNHWLSHSNFDLRTMFILRIRKLDRIHLCPLHITQIIRWVVCLAAMLHHSTVSATVMEWDQAGKAVIQEGAATERNDKVKPLPEKKPPGLGAMPPAGDLERALNRKLSREIALKFSGADGVVAARLTALEFIDLFEAIIQRESSFDHRALSEKGAQGLGQLMPDTAKDLGVKNPFDAYENLNASARYFTALLAEFKRTDLALAAYNSGPNRVKEVGRIPHIQETQDYVRWILSRAGHPIPKMPAEQPVNGKRAGQQESSVLLETSAKTKAEEPLTGDVSVWEF